MATRIIVKKDKDIKRNSLVVESIKMILLIKPKVFVFENVKAFLKTNCTDRKSVV